MNREEIEEICELVKDYTKCSQLVRMMDLSLRPKVFLCLKTLGSGSFQSTSKDFLKVTQPTVSKVLIQFVNSITTKASRYIYWQETERKLQKRKKIFIRLQDFHE